jgi:hypothetical protein
MEVTKVPARVKDARTEALAGKFTVRERKMIEAEAERQKMTASEYVRVAVMTTLVLDGNVDALKLLGGLMRDRLAEKLGFTEPARIRGYIRT